MVSMTETLQYISVYACTWGGNISTGKKQVRQPAEDRSTCFALVGGGCLVYETNPVPRIACTTKNTTKPLWVPPPALQEAAENAKHARAASSYDVEPDFPPTRDNRSHANAQPKPPWCISPKDPSFKTMHQSPQYRLVTGYWLSPQSGDGRIRKGIQNKIPRPRSWCHDDAYGAEGCSRSQICMLFHPIWCDKIPVASTELMSGDQGFIAAYVHGTTLCSRPVLGK